jgi:tetratricopeptide (TPR) repeat protein
VLIDVAPPASDDVHVFKPGAVAEEAPLRDRADRHEQACTAALGVTLLLPLTLVLARPVGAEPIGSALAKESLVSCDQAEELSGAAQRAALRRGLQLADQAIAADAHDAKAHFAAFCNLGKRLRVDGVGFSRWTNYRRLRRELDTTLALAPDDPDALAGKGALLLHLPRLLGGDAVEAERLLRRALDIEPDNRAARRYLAEMLEDRGATDQARALLAAR